MRISRLPGELAVLFGVYDGEFPILHFLEFLLFPEGFCLGIKIAYPDPVQVFILFHDGIDFGRIAHLGEFSGIIFRVGIIGKGTHLHGVKGFFFEGFGSDNFFIFILRRRKGLGCGGYCIRNLRSVSGGGGELVEFDFIADGRSFVRGGCRGLLILPVRQSDIVAFFLGHG